MVDVRGAFRVNKVNWSSSNLQYAVLFLKDRLIFAKIGGQFADSGIGMIVGITAFGAVGTAFGQRIDEKLGAKAKKNETKIKKMSVDDILKLDKVNFQIFYKDIKSVAIKKSRLGINGQRVGVFTVNGNKFDIAVKQKYDECEKLAKNNLKPSK